MKRMNVKRLLHGWSVVTIVSLISVTAFAYDGIVEKRIFSMPTYITANGRMIKDLKVGWEAYGKLNVARDNVVLICHNFSANSHAAGKYHADDKLPGYWDSIIGEGKPIDTNKYYVMGIDSLVNLNSKDGITVTTGPSSINPDTGKPYGMTFPVVTITDFVRVQKALMDSLAIKKLKMVGGPSMGGLQGYEWAAAYPEMVERVLGVISVPVQNPYAAVDLDRWALQVKLDPNWKNGDYYGGPEPTEGVAQAFYNIIVGARHPDYISKAFSWKLSNPGKSPMESVNNGFASQSALYNYSKMRAEKTTDANNLLYMAHANILFTPGMGSSVDPELKKIKAKILMIASRTDLLFPPSQMHQHYEQFKKNGNQVQFVVLDSPGGHLGGITDIAKEGKTIQRFLNSR